MLGFRRKRTNLHEKYDYPYLVFGDLQEGLTLFGFVVVTLALTLFQEGRTERAIEALRDLTSPRALVIRDGQRQRIAGRDVVRGDS